MSKAHKKMLRRFNVTMAKLPRQHRSHGAAKIVMLLEDSNRIIEKLVWRPHLDLRQESVPLAYALRYT